MAKKNTENHLIVIKNKKASFEYFLTEIFEAGIQLTGTEIKSLRAGEANIKDAYCVFVGTELFVKSLFIADYKYGSTENHETRRDRKLLLNRTELRKLNKRVSEKGFTIVPTRLYVNDRGMAKLEIALAQGKKSYDKRHSIKEKDQKRELDRLRRT